MNSYFVVLFKVLVGGITYSTLSNFYFETEKDARGYALRFVADSKTFSTFEILNIIPFNHECDECIYVYNK